MNTEVFANVGNFGGLRFLFFLCDNTSTNYFGFGDHEWVGYGFSL